MPQFQKPAGSWQEVDCITQGYLEALFFTNEEELGEAGLDDMAAETLAQAVAACDDLRRVFDMQALIGFGEADDVQVGRDLWFTRNGHGVGFWDRPELYGQNLADKLTDYCKALATVEPYLGDDGKIYFT